MVGCLTDLSWSYVLGIAEGSRQSNRAKSYQLREWTEATKYAHRLGIESDDWVTSVPIDTIGQLVPGDWVYWENTNHKAEMGWQAGTQGHNGVFIGLDVVTNNAGKDFTAPCTALYGSWENFTKTENDIRDWKDANGLQGNPKFSMDVKVPHPKIFKQK